MPSVVAQSFWNIDELGEATEFLFSLAIAVSALSITFFLCVICLAVGVLDSCIVIDDTIASCDESLAHICDVDFDHAHVQRVATLDRLVGSVALH